MRALFVLALVALAAARPVAGAKTNACKATSSRPISEVAAQKIVGAAPHQVAGAGDVNGDGAPDVIVTSQLVFEGGDAPRAYVVYGSDEPGTVNVHALGTKGFAILPPESGEGSFLDINGAGDVNQDGYADVITGAPGQDHNGSWSGSAYVIFGSPTPRPVPLTLFDAGLQEDLGFRIDGPKPDALAGRVVDGLGDVNGDGASDVIVGAPFADKAYVVFGKNDPEPVDLSEVERGEGGGFAIKTPWVPQSDFLATIGPRRCERRRPRRYLARGPQPREPQGRGGGLRRAWDEESHLAQPRPPRVPHQRLRRQVDRGCR
jgi:hypothetical protein